MAFLEVPADPPQKKKENEQNLRKFWHNIQNDNNLDVEVQLNPFWLDDGVEAGAAQDLEVNHLHMPTVD